MFITSGFTTAAVAAALLLAPLNAVAAERTRATAASGTSGSCGDLVKTDFRTESSLVSTFSTSITNLANGSLAFVQGGAAAGCAIVRFSAETDATSNGGIDVRLVLESGAVARPGTVFWASNHSIGPSVQSFEFVFPSVAPGPHTARVQWRSFNGTRITFGYRTLTVTHP